MFEEPNGGLSAYRVAYLLYMSLFCIAYFINSVRSGTMAQVPWEVVVSLLGMEAGKVAQRKVESIKEETNEDNKTP
jgi:hypothetical protein